MILRTMIAFAVVAVASAASAKSNGVLYDCDITRKHERLYWIADKIAIVVKNDGQVVVFDEVILNYHQRPMNARVTRDTDAKLAIRWTLKDLVNNSKQFTRALEYSATLNKSTNNIAVFAKPDGYPNRFSGKGTCTPRIE